MNNAYKARWARSGQDTPEVLFDKEFRPDTRNISVHILWYACVQGKDYPHVTGYGTTIQDALEDLLSQLYEGPQKWLAKLAVERDAFVSELKQKQMAKDKKHSPVQLATKPSAAILTPPSSSLVAPSPPVSDGPPTQVSNINSTGHPAVSKKPTNKIASKPQVVVAGSHQDSKPKSDTLFKNLPAWVLGPKTADFKSAGSSSSPGFAFGFGQSPSSFGNQFLSSTPSVPTPKFGDGIKPCNFTGLFGEKAVLEEARQREKRKEEDMESDEDEEDWEKRDAARQARKKAKLLTVIQPSKRTFGSFLQPLQPARATHSWGSAQPFSGTLLPPPTPPAFSPSSNPNIIRDTNTTTFHAGGSNNAGFFQKSSTFPTLPASSGMPQKSVKREDLLSRLPAETEEGRKIRQGFEKKIADYQVERKIKVEHSDTSASHAGESRGAKFTPEFNWTSSANIGSHSSLFGMFGSYPQ
ncbi:hypothetical protein D6D20_10118 [Aureobasidium pullulans]|uniref:Uncharacterized protein n=1 Tax=Aureobasidium pullulans TaxID=5580 RepID=A0A4V4L2P0_AURPU|nr:hypothetical protein D6D20_10118 [Aureobasidium pullulans]THZ90196.1 hypothetical protein D6C82_10521 [Aureobasidium pullulans]